MFQERSVHLYFTVQLFNQHSNMANSIVQPNKLLS